MYTHRQEFALKRDFEWVPLWELVALPDVLPRIAEESLTCRKSQQRHFASRLLLRRRRLVELSECHARRGRQRRLRPTGLQLRRGRAYGVRTSATTA